jgi:thioredoxin 1
MKAIFFIYILSLIYVHIATAIRPKSANYASMISIGDKEEGLAYERLSQVLRVRGGGVWDVQTEGGFNGLLEKAGKKDLVVVDFSAAWCGPCKMIAPAFDDLSNEYPDCFFVKVDVDQVKAIAKRYEIMSMPTFILFRNGKVVERFSGASIEKLRDMIIANR